jgi:hypothetical protein
MQGLKILLSTFSQPGTAIKEKGKVRSEKGKVIRTEEQKSIRTEAGTASVKLRFCLAGNDIIRVF